MSRVIIPLILLFTGIIMIIRAQPYDDDGLHALLTPPEGCNAPCFLGVRPGETPLDEAGETLVIQPAVEQVVLTAGGELYGLELAQSGAASAFTAPRFRVQSNRVRSILLQTEQLRWGDFWLALGPPSNLLLLDDGTQNIKGLAAIYPQYGFYLYTTLHICTLKSSTLWSITGNWITVTYTPNPLQPERLNLPEATYPEHYSTRLLGQRDLPLDAWQRQMRALCQSG
ncbi:MAG: hypothetical protein K8L97_08055 [Anaerolineae bacterium]|nr:hypothetical protein [Anaerolineae bacterium]